MHACFHRPALQEAAAMTPTPLADSKPLAERLRPRTLSEVIGQRHLLGDGKPLSIVWESHKLHSMILWGPPGVGKTTLARLLSEGLGYEWISLSAVFAGVKDIRAAMDAAQSNQALQRPTVLFVDEIHRFNKSQQDGLLPFVESGLVTLIGATTENPSFELNKALLSRARVYVLQSLTEEELDSLLERAIATLPWPASLPPSTRGLLTAMADGDGRRLLNLYEQLSQAVSAPPSMAITNDWVASILHQSLRRFDKDGENFYDQISALHKSVRGSDPNAALYWLCRMLDGGTDPAYLARRIVRMAWEDIGIADPRALQIANDAASTYERLGSPEGELALGVAVVYLAVAAKSNAAYRAFNEAKAFVAQDQSREVPLHLRNAPTALMKELGHGAEYRYAHDEPHGYAAGVHYWPDALKPQSWYAPTERGIEGKISEKMAFLRTLDANAVKERAPPGTPSKPPKP